MNQVKFNILSHYAYDIFASRLNKGSGMDPQARHLTWSLLFIPPDNVLDRACFLSVKFIFGS